MEKVGKFIKDVVVSIVFMVVYLVLWIPLTILEHKKN